MQQVKLSDNVSFPEAGNPTKMFLFLGLAGLLISFIGYFTDKDQFFFSYLTSFSFIASIALSSLFLVMIHHITRSSWGITVRRIPEAFMSALLLIAFLFIPVFFGMHSLYHWTHEDAVAADPILSGKVPYLNIPFYIIRNVIYFSIWAFLGYRLYQNSIKMDETGDWGLETLQRKISAPGIFIFAFTVSFASFDWLMSLDPHWFSTMFGVYFFAMGFQVTLAVVILMGLFLRSRGLLTSTIKIEHYSDLGKLMFGFTVFYAYIAFSQMFLIYYANIPEETLWFYHRMEGNWAKISYLLIIGRFALPFLILLPASSKANLKILGAVSIWLVVIHFLELYWIVMPTLHAHDIHFHWLDVTTFAGLVGIFMWYFFNKFTGNSMVAINDPRLAESLNKH